MGKEKAAVPSAWMQAAHELLKTEIYKRSQGRIVRQVTFGVICVTFALAAYDLFVYLKASTADIPVALIYALPCLVLLVGIWVGYRVVNLPSFADFLIAVEAEMNKVSWPSRTELIRASLVVIVLMFGLTMVLFAYDLILTSLLKAMGVVV